MIVPNRKGLSEGDAWVELEDHVQSLIALIALRRKLPWRTSMVQMLEVAERLVEKSANFMRVETDACIWGAGGVNEKLRQFFRIVHPEWVRKEIRHASIRYRNIFLYFFLPDSQDFSCCATLLPVKID